MERIAFIGLGNMGNSMAKNLIAAGFDVVGFDADSRTNQRSAETGIPVAADVVDAVTGADVVITMLPNGDILRQVLLGAGAESGVLNYLAPGALVIDSSSIDVANCLAVHESAASAGIAFLDAPVSGGVGGAAAGTLTFMVGGDEAHVRRAWPLFEAMGKKVVRVGGPSTGQAVKMCNQMIYASSLVAVAEAFSLADKLGVAPKMLFEVVTSSSGDCWAIRNSCPWPDVVEGGSAADEGFAPRFSSRLMSKDLRLATSAASNVGQPLPLTGKTVTFYEKVAVHEPALDVTAVIREINEAGASTATVVTR
ncbi:3-hydroxyisobutyrate dehydrogenase [Nocardioides sp. JS614]|nr:3-hydroxyisobutyrate dehydrogenase [Nocardioides sp. JS614]